MFICYAEDYHTLVKQDKTRNKAQSIMPYRKSPLYAVKFLKTPNIQKKNHEIQRGIEKLRTGVKTRRLA